MEEKKKTKTTPDVVNIDTEMNALADRVLIAIRKKMSRHQKTLFMNELDFLNDFADDVDLWMDFDIANKLYPACPLYVWTFRFPIGCALLLLFDRGDLSVVMCKHPGVMAFSTGVFTERYKLLTDARQMFADKGARRRWILMSVELGRANPDCGYWEIVDRDNTWNTMERYTKFTWNVQPPPLSSAEKRLIGKVASAKKPTTAKHRKTTK